MLYISKSSKYLEFISLIQKCLIMTRCNVSSFKKAISKVSKRFCTDSNSEKLDPLFSSGQPSYASEYPSVLRSFEQFKVASVQMSWQHVRTFFRVREDSSFPSQIRSGKTACTRSDVRATPSKH